MKLTQRQKDAIRIIGKKRMSAREFAEAFWPDHNMHTKVSNGGNGAQAGKAGWLCGGSYLAKLRKKGLVYWDDGVYRLTYEGLKIYHNELT